MLKELKITNLAIIDDLTVEFATGLNVITGETGAGKSIIVDSLGLALGERFQSDWIRAGEKEAVVQAFFEGVAVEKLAELGIDPSEGLILRRSLSAAGRSRAYVNDTMVSLQSLHEIGRSLVDIHGQHEHQSLLSAGMQRNLLDAFGQLHDDVSKFRKLYRDTSDLKKELTETDEAIRERARRIDLLTYQIQEIEEAALKEGEKEQLLERRSILANMGKLKELAGLAYDEIYESEGSCMGQLSSLMMKLREMAAIDKDARQALDMLESTRPLLEDVALFLRERKERYEFEPDEFANIEERLETIRKLGKKYGESFETIVGFRGEAEEELRMLKDSDTRRESLEDLLKATQSELEKAAGSLTKRRKETAARLSEIIRSELGDLAFAGAEFEIKITEDSIASHGADKVEFLFSANPGEPPRSLAKIASGGELSRVMLALKSVLADFDSVPVLIFDEVDAGIGGRTAESVGKKLMKIAVKRQVLCTTHLPQIAARGDRHLKTEKKKAGERVRVEVKPLSATEKENEIARMLSGRITDVSLKHARELIESSGRIR